MRLILFQSRTPYDFDGPGFYLKNLDTNNEIGPMSENEAQTLKTSLEEDYDYPTEKSRY